MNAVSVSFDDKHLHCHLGDGRIISTPLEWYPSLLQATVEERNNWKLVGRGVGIWWPDLDEDLSVKGMFLGTKGYK